MNEGKKRVVVTHAGDPVEKTYTAAEMADVYERGAAAARQANALTNLLVALVRRAGEPIIITPDELDEKLSSFQLRSEQHKQTGGVTLTVEGVEIRLDEMNDGSVARVL